LDLYNGKNMHTKAVKLLRQYVGTPFSSNLIFRNFRFVIDAKSDRY